MYLLYNLCTVWKRMSEIMEAMISRHMTAATGKYERAARKLATISYLQKISHIQSQISTCRIPLLLVAAFCSSSVRFLLTFCVFFLFLFIYFLGEDLWLHWFLGYFSSQLKLLFKNVLQPVMMSNRSNERVGYRWEQLIEISSSAIILRFGSMTHSTVGHAWVLLKRTSSVLWGFEKGG